MDFERIKILELLKEENLYLSDHIYEHYEGFGKYKIIRCHQYHLGFGKRTKDKLVFVKESLVENKSPLALIERIGFPYSCGEEFEEKDLFPGLVILERDEKKIIGSFEEGGFEIELDEKNKILKINLNCKELTIGNYLSGYKKFLQIPRTARDEETCSFLNKKTFCFKTFNRKFRTDSLNMKLHGARDGGMDCKYKVKLQKETDDSLEFILYYVDVFGRLTKESGSINKKNNNYQLNSSTGEMKGRLIV